MAGAALLVVDLQVGMFGNDWEPPLAGADSLVPRVAGLIADARAAGTPVVFVRHDGGEQDPILHAGLPTFEIHPALAPLPGEEIVDKAVPDAFHQTALADVLARLDADRLIVVGAQTDCCIDATCRRAVELGYDTVLVADAHSTWDSDGRTAQEIVGRTNLELNALGVRLAEAANLRFAPS